MGEVWGGPREAETSRLPGSILLGPCFTDSGAVHVNVNTQDMLLKKLRCCQCGKGPGLGQLGNTEEQDVGVASGYMFQRSWSCAG